MCLFKRLWGTALVPAGEAEWTQQLSIRQGITITGKGSDDTKIIWNGKGRHRETVFYYSPDDPKGETYLDISGFGIDLKETEEACAFIISNRGTPHFIKKIRIHHNSVINGVSRVIRIEGSIYGLMDNNRIESAGILRVLGDNDLSWEKPLEPGTANYW